MTRRLGMLVWLLGVWLFLWEDPSPANVLSGLALGVVLVTVFPPTGTNPVRIRPVAAVRLAVHFVVKLVEANLVVAWEVVTPGSGVNEGIVAVPIDEERDGVIALVANAVSLTPGTLTLEVHRNPTVLYVHVLHLRSLEDAREEVRTFHRLAVAAFPAPEVVS